VLGAPEQSGSLYYRLASIARRKLVATKPADTAPYDRWPEYALVEEDEVRWEAVREAGTSISWSHVWRFLVTVILGKLFQGTVQGIYPFYYLPPWLWNGLVFGAAPIAVGWSLESRKRRAFWLALSRRGVPICTGCGYSRKGIDTSAPCPECGRAPKPAPLPPA
jgi:hypothetical protein